MPRANNPPKIGHHEQASLHVYGDAKQCLIQQVDELIMIENRETLDWLIKALQVARETLT